MSKKEEVQTNIGLLQNLILAFLGALFAVWFCFFATQRVNLYEFIFLAVVVVLLSGIICFFGVLYNKQRKRLRDL